jgi:hypothetical protein
MDLIETLLFLMYLILAGVAWITTHIILLRAKTKKTKIQAANKACIIATIAVILISLVHLKLIFGRIYSPFGGPTTDSIHRSFINHDGEEMQYWVEFKNPFHESHEEFIVLAKGDEQSRIQIMAKRDDKPFCIGTDTDRILLQDSSYLLHTEFEPWIDRFFLIDPNALNVISNWVVNTKPIKTESNQQVDPIVTTPVDKVEAQSTQGHP